jgi:hypothetical protein
MELLLFLDVALLSFLLLTPDGAAVLERCLARALPELREPGDIRSRAESVLRSLLPGLEEPEDPALRALRIVSCETFALDICTYSFRLEEIVVGLA